MNGIIQGIKVIKMYAWEYSFAEMIQKSRKAEIQIIQRAGFYKAINEVFNFTSAKIIMVSFLLVLFLNGKVLRAEDAFLTLAFFNVFRTSVSIIARGIQTVSEALISIKRVQDFLQLEELDQTTSSNVISNINEPGPSFIKMRSVHGKWNEKYESNTLDNINLDAKSGQLIAIVGPVGCGKSSIFNGILGEMPTHQGKIQIKGQLSYASQEAWVFSGNVRQNILFGQPFDAKRYAEVLRVCDLNQDIKKFDHGDLTLVGERGIALSGGQKARVNLARAIYRKADIYLLDDPLSAVDAHVGNHLFHQCMKGFLKDKVVILITHQIQYLKGTDQIIVIHEGNDITQ